MVGEVMLHGVYGIVTKATQIGRVRVVKEGCARDARELGLGDRAVGIRVGVGREGEEHLIEDHDWDGLSPREVPVGGYRLSSDHDRRAQCVGADVEAAPRDVRALRLGNGERRARV